MPVDKVPEKNSIFFVWLNNYAGILLKTPTKTLIIDPVDIKPKNYPQIDAILLTHEHYDHLDQRLIEELQKATNCQIIADPTSTKRLKNILPPNKLTEATVGYQTNLGKVNIKTEKCKHNATTPVTYIITSEDNLKTFHTADSQPYPEMATMAQKEQFDLVFCTVGIAPGATPETGAEIAWLTKPKIAVPYHTNTVQSQKNFQAIIRKDQPKTTCLIPEQNKIYQVTKPEVKT